MVFFIQLGIDGRPQAILKVANQEVICRIDNTIKLFQDGLQMLYVG